MNDNIKNRDYHRRHQSNHERIMSGYGIEDNIAFGTNRFQQHKFGRAYLFGKKNEEYDRKARFYSFEANSVEGIEEYFKEHPFIRDPSLRVPINFEEINGAIQNSTPKVLISPDAELIIPFEYNINAQKLNADKYISELRYYGKTSPWKHHTNKENSSIPEIFEEEVNNSEAVAYIEELEKLLTSLSLPTNPGSNKAVDSTNVKNTSGIISSDEEHEVKKAALQAESAPEPNKNVKKAFQSGKSVRAISPIDKIPLTSERCISTDKVNFAVYKASRKFMKYDGRTDIHCCDYESDGIIKLRNAEPHDDYNVDAINARLRARKQETELLITNRSIN